MAKNTQICLHRIDLKRGLGIITVANVPDIILPAEKLASYILYYLAHQKHLDSLRLTIRTTMTPAAASLIAKS